MKKYSMSKILRTSVFLLIFSFSLLSLRAIGQSKIMNQGEMISKNAYHEISISNSKDEIVQFVNLKNKSFKFIFDTGAPLSISKELQDAIRYPILLKVPMRDAENKSDTINIVSVDTFRLGNITFINIPAVVINLKNSPLGPENIDGLIGSNIARFLIIQFNLNENKIILTDQLDKVNIINKKNPHQIFLDNQSNAFLQISLSNNLMDTAHFDSGMGKFYSMNIKKAEQFISVLDNKTSTVLKGYGVSSQGILGNKNKNTQYMITSSIMLGGSPISRCRIGTTQAVSRIGRELMNYGTLTIDYINKQYYFDIYPNNKYQPSPNFGFQVITEQGKVSAGMVWENTLAQKKGITSGCEIVSINKKTVQNLSSSEIDNIISTQFAKEKIRLTFLKDNKIKKAILYKLN